MTKSITVSLGYGAGTRRSLGEILTHQIKEMKSERGLTTSGSLKVETDTGDILATKLYGNVCFEYSIDNEARDIKRGFVWHNEKHLPPSKADHSHINTPLISAGDMQSVQLRPDSAHKVPFSLHKYHSTTPSGGAPLSRMAILQNMHTDLESLRQGTLAQFNARNNAALNYSEVQVVINPNTEQKITRVIFNSGPGLSRFPFDHLFQNQQRHQFYTPSEADFQYFMIFQAALVQYEFYTKNVNKDDQIIPMYARVCPPGSKIVTLQYVTPDYILEVLLALQQTPHIFNNLTTSSHDGVNIQLLCQQDFAKIGELIQFQAQQLQAQQLQTQQLRNQQLRAQQLQAQQLRDQQLRDQQLQAQQLQAQQPQAQQPQAQQPQAQQPQAQQPQAQQPQAQPSTRPSWFRTTNSQEQNNGLLSQLMKRMGYDKFQVYDVKNRHDNTYAKAFSFEQKELSDDFAGHFNVLGKELTTDGKYHKVVLSNEDAKSLTNRDGFLTSSGFSNSLNAFKAKTTSMLTKSQTNQEYLAAHQRAAEFCKALEDASIQYLKSGNKAALKTTCQAICDSAKNSVLKNHREWKGSIAKFVTDVLSTITFGLTNRLSLFARTDSIKKIDDFEQAVVNGI